MPVFISELIGQLKGIWTQLKGAQKLTVLAVLLATFVGLCALVYVGSRPDYQPFRNKLEGEDRRQAILSLEQANIDYRINGDALEVNGKDRDR
ncbi:MAG: hypothetical protein ACE5F1_22110, partial [Planctomycetota bacterium]